MSSKVTASAAAELAGVKLEPGGYAVCPRCSRKVNCGAGGLNNLALQHWRSKGCKKGMKAKDNTPSIASFFATTSKPAYVPPRIHTPPPVQPQLDAIPADTSTTRTYAPPARQELSPHTVDPEIADLLPSKHHALRLLHALRVDAKSMPETVPISAPGDALYEFSRAGLVAASACEAWETLDPALNRLFGWGITVEDAAKLVRRGDEGIEGVCRVIEAFVVAYDGITGDLLEGKIDLMTRAIRYASGLSLDSSSQTTPALPPHHTPQRSQAAMPSIAEPSATSQAKSPPPSPSLEIICLSSTMHDQGQTACNGLPLASEHCPTPIPFYPFQMHVSHTLPWDVELRRHLLYARAHGCTHKATKAKPLCPPCSALENNNTLTNVRRRMETGVPENAPLQYHGSGGLMELARRKTLIIDELRLGYLSQTRQVIRLEGVVNAHKELVIAISNGKVARVHRILQICLRRGARVDTMLGMVYRAQAGLYHPKSYDEEDELKGLLVWRLGGSRMASIAHRMFGTPSISTLRQRASIAKFVPSPATPTTAEVLTNFNAGFGPILDLLSSVGEEIWHAVAMYDELAIEKRPRWDEKTNKFIGICRECQSAHGMEFCCREDLEMLFEEIEQGKIHLASEATVGAIGLLSADTRLYSARPILLSGSCKNEDSVTHAKMIETTLNAVNSRRPETKIRIVSIASDGEARRGKALIQLTFKAPLALTSPLYPLLAPLWLLDLHVGDDDVTADKDYKHVAFKRVRNTLLREKGVLVLGIYLVPPVLRKHLRDVGHSSPHVESLLNTSDKQDVELAYLLEHDLATLPPALPSKSDTYIQTRDAMRVFGTLCHHLIFPYVCVDLDLTEQVVHHSSAAHMLLALYRCDDAKGAFLPTPLMIDLMIMIKNLLFCIAKAKVDKPKSQFYFVSQGTDRVETLFGILRTMVGNDCNLDALQLALRVTGTTEVANILARHPEWDRSPRRLKLPVITRDGQPVPGADHVTPRLWRGNVDVAGVNLATCWKRGRQAAEEVHARIRGTLQAIDSTPGASILAPFGTLLVHVPSLTDDDLEDLERPPQTSVSLSSADGQVVAADLDPSISEGLCDVEEAAADEHARDVPTSSSSRSFPRTIDVDGAPMNKARALAQRFKYNVVAHSADRLKRVAQESRFNTNTANALQSELFLDAGPLVAVSHPIATLLICDDHFFLAVGEITALKLHSKAIEHIPAAILNEESVELSFQLTSLRPASAVDDPTLKHDWRSGQLLPYLHTIPGALAQVIDPELAANVEGRPYYLFSSEDLVALASTLHNKIVLAHGGAIPVVRTRSDYPYRERRGFACFSTGSRDVSMRSHDHCAYCNYPFDFGKMPRVMAHIGSHILHDTKNIIRTLEPCGLCLRSFTACQIYMRRTKGRRGNLKIDVQRSTCNMPLNFKPASAAKSHSSSPCSNAPLLCALCPKDAPAVWRYNFRAHMLRAHPTVALDTHEDIWQLTDYEKDQMHEIWTKRHKHPKLRRKPEEHVPLVISEAHTSQMALRQSTMDEGEAPPAATAAAAALIILDGADPSDGEEEEAEASEASVSLSSWKGDNDDETEDEAEALIDTFEMMPDSAMEGVLSTDGTSTTSTGVPASEQNEDNAPIIILPHQPSSNPEGCMDERHNHAPLLSPTQADFSASRATRASRKRKAVVKPPCEYCGDYAGEDDRPVIECSGAGGGDGCATQWYHLACVGLESVPPRWKCSACKRPKRS